MKKNIIIFLILFLLVPSVVNAGGSSDDASVQSYPEDENWIYCKYEIGEAAVYSYYYNTTTNTFTPTARAQETRLTVVSNLKVSDFVDAKTKKLFCPAIYVATGTDASGRSATYTAYGTEKEGATKHEVTEKKENIVEKKVEGNDDEKNVAETVYCVYDTVTFTIDITNKKVLSAEIPNYNVTSFDHSFEDLYDIESKTCNCVKINKNCTVRDGNYCSIKNTGVAVVCSGEQKVLEETISEDSNVETTGAATGATTFDFCEEVGVLKTFRLVGYAFTIIKILIPLLLIIFGAVDMAKAVVAGDEKAIKTSSTMLMTRAIAGVIIFFIPTIVDAATSLLADWADREKEFKNCDTCLFNTDKCSTIIEKLEK